MSSLMNGRWHNVPRKSRTTVDKLSVKIDPYTDFWSETHYGFTRDSGHFYAFKAAEDFTAQACVQASFEHLYDQAGLMVRLDERH